MQTGGLLFYVVLVTVDIMQQAFMEIKVSGTQAN
jgi:hypothetical protein